MLLFLVTKLYAHVVAEEDPCTFINENYCFYFGQMPCYMKICECELRNCTNINDCLLSPWCHPSGKLIKTNETFTAIDLGCDSLKNNCMTQSQYHGYCLLYRRSCPKSEEVEKKLDSKTPKNSRKDCAKWKRKCAAKYPKHFACRQYKKKCGPLNFPIGKNSPDEGSSDKSEGMVKNNSEKRNPNPKNTQKDCAKWKRKCAVKYRKHFTCIQYKKKCGPIDFPIGNKTTGEGSSRRFNERIDDDNEEDNNEVKK
ncbi:hypothetical protein V3C99_011289 [Haemonchus contortus]